MDTQVLEELGLSPTEIKIYLALLELGSASAKEIMQKSKTQNSSLHFSLNNLIEKGLITYVLQGKGRLYQAGDPEQFNRYIDEKKERFQSLLPKLKEKQFLAKKKESASIYKGIRGITEVYYKLVNESGKEYNSFGGGKPCADRMGLTWWYNLHKKRVANKLTSRQVFDESVRDVAGPIESNPLTHTKYVSRDFEGFQETVIVGDYVAITVFSEHPYSFLIHDADVAKSYRIHFEVLWSQAN